MIFLLFVGVGVALGKTCSGFPDDTCSSGLTKRDPGDMHEAGETWSESECCYDECKSADLTCTANKVLNEHHRCYGTVCTADSCCKRTCASFSETCPDQKIKRGVDDYYEPPGGVWSESECCLTTCASFPDDTCPAGKVKRRDMHQPAGGVWAESECCEVDRSCGNHVCPTDKTRLDDEECEVLYSSGSGTSTVKCTDDKCCAHPLEAQCQSDKAMECSKCATYAPCLSSVDPHCIRPEALACLYCDQKYNLTHCAVCAPGYDQNCAAHQEFKSNGCKEADLHYQIPFRFTEECDLLPPFASNGNRKFDFTAGTELEECNEDCSECTTTDTTPQSVIDKADICEDDNTESSRIIGEFDTSAPGPACPRAAPCGPASCVPGTDAKCIVFTIFNMSSACSVADDLASYDTVGDYHAFAIGDNTCRQDAGGRSYYKMTFDPAADKGAGVIGCTDDACSAECTTVSMARATCETPTWANGLQLVANTKVADFSESSSPSSSSSSSSPVATPTITTAAASLKLTYPAPLSTAQVTTLEDTVCTSYQTLSGIPIEDLDCIASVGTARRRLLAETVYDVEVRTTTAAATTLLSTPVALETFENSTQTALATLASSDPELTPTSVALVEVVIVLPTAAPTAAAPTSDNFSEGHSTGASWALGLVVAAAVCVTA